jgi:tRNA G18 (ribose-2'-O)-methylase SpoU
MQKKVQFITFFGKSVLSTMSISNKNTSIISTVAVVTSFILGSVLSYVYICSTFHALPEKRRCCDDVDDDDTTTTTTIVPTSQPIQEKIYDAPDLDVRLIRKAEAVILKRTDKVIIVIERCTNDHNYSAILRTAEALGIQTICLIDPPPATTIDENGNVVLVDQSNDCNDCETTEITPSSNLSNDNLNSTAEISSNNTNNGGTNGSSSSFLSKVVRLSDSERKAFSDHRKFAQNATEWLTIREFSNAIECIQALRNEEGYAIWVTDLSQVAVPLTKTDLQEYSCWPLPDKIAIVMGTEAVGCSVDMLSNADVRCYLPLYGFADSLNLSVATALVLQQIFHLQPNYIGNLSNQSRQQLREQWFPKLAQQRLLGARSKKQRRAIMKQIETCQRLQVRYDTGETLTPEQVIKMNQISEHHRALHELENKCHLDQASIIIQDMIQNPPQPLSDLRRADIHRVTFVGKNVKKKHQYHWKDMVAISTKALPRYTTAAFFRSRIANMNNDQSNDESNAEKNEKVVEN